MKKGKNLLGLFLMPLLFGDGLPSLGRRESLKKHVCKNCDKDFYPDSCNKATYCNPCGRIWATKKK